MPVDYAARDGGSGVATYDVVYKIGVTGQGYGPWIRPAEWQGTTATSLSIGLEASDHVCFAVRARDRAGNLSAWAFPPCGYVDGTAPTRATVTAPRLIGAGNHSRADYPLTWRATDDDQVVSYDLWERHFNSVQAYLGSPKEYEAGWGNAVVSYRETDPTPESVVNAGGTRCVRVRARDAAGNVGAWSSERCTTAVMLGSWLAWSPPYRFSARALENDWAEVQPGRSLPSTHWVTGGSLRLYVRTGPRQGNMDVYVGSTNIGRVDTYAPKNGTRVVYLRPSRDFQGRLTLRSTSRYPVHIISWTGMP
ncbi:hypothetical protein [Cellulosimicrobium marinum]|uniref:hypothetical protein n=1 Tax=Cellulosimicrobium marinum TaxID=1638992 RepID=UPI001E37D6F4|nr:hypothetical protein [Cellulosimicrobium marinum]MCB7138173.1 hypothetical protein [Cellulosimicrobium marinum]